MIKISKLKHEVAFRPYLKSFSVKRKIPTHAIQETSTLFSKEVIVFNSEKPSFNISFTVVSTSVSEAKFNHEKIQRLLRMMWADKIDGLTKRAEMNVKFANLISKGTILGVGSNSVNEGSLKVMCKKISFKPDFDLGFFEHRGMLYMKSFDLQLSLETIDKTLIKTRI